MKILSTFLFAFSLLYSANAQRLYGIHRSENEGGGLYIAVDFASGQAGEDPINEFSVHRGSKGTRTGTIPINNQGVFNDINASLGFQQVIADDMSIRLEGGLRWMRFDLENPTYSHIDFAPLPLDQINQMVQMNGEVKVRGPRAGIFLDLSMGDSGGFAYFGSSFGLVNMAGQYEATIGDFSISLNDDTAATMMSWETGIVARLGGHIGMRLGYEWTRISDFNWTTMAGGLVSATPGDRHMVKLGVFHFFRKR